MTTLVTGAAGHVGGVLVRELLARGRRVRVLVRSDDRALAGLDVERARGDVLDEASLRAALAGVEVVYHLAALISIDGGLGGRVHAVNVEGARRMARLALEAGVRRMIHCCSIHALEERPAGAVIDESRERALGAHNPPYDRSKALGEAAVREVIAEGLDAVILHPTGIVGPYDFRPSRMGEVLLGLFRRTLPGISEGGYDWVDVRDVAAGMIAAEERGRRGESYLLSGGWRSVREVARLCEAITGVPAPRFVSPLWLARLTAPIAAEIDRLRGRPLLFTPESVRALTAHRHVSSEKARRELGFSPRPLEESLYDAYAWFAETGRIRPPRPLRRPAAPRLAEDRLAAEAASR